MVPVTEIRRYENQPRKYFDDEKIRQLSVGIEQSGQAIAGLIHAIDGDVPYRLIDGERRWRAILLIPEDRRPLFKADLIKADEEVIRFLVSGMANLNRVGHTPMEMAEAIDTYLGFNMSMEEISAVLGVSVGWCYQIHSLTRLDKSVSELLSPERPKSEQLPVNAAIQISKIHPSLQLNLAKQVIEKQIPLGGLRKAVIETAVTAGVEVRTREVDPSKQWQSIGRRLTQSHRALRDVRSRSTSFKLNKYFDGTEIAQEDFIEEVRNIENLILELSKKIARNE